MSGGSLNLNSTFGAFLIAAIVSAWLFGITCAQTWYYYGHYSDSIFLKALVGIVWTLEAVHAAFACHAAYFYVVTQYGIIAGLAEATWSASVSFSLRPRESYRSLLVELTVCVTGIITLMVHLFYARQLYFVSNRNVFLVSALLFLAVCRVATSAAVAGFSMRLKRYALFETPVMTNLMKTAMSLYLATDVLVAASLCYYLHTSRTGLKRTDTIINKLIFYAINNGLLTGQSHSILLCLLTNDVHFSVTDLLVIVFNQVYPSNLVYLSLYQVVANLYSNSFLATLNSRRPTKMTHIDNKLAAEDNIVRLDNFEVNMSPLQDSSRSSAAVSMQHIDIHITRTTETIRDGDDSSPEYEPKSTQL
ncbi:hypothetical protein ARMGADRAFT_1090973 [Armillaria gallica]|uniref:DUF6534 domain-containing protein n=1 Tax=Armillaria gallica TaxID=47427 RepID=A0A2H3CK56_ARMGA|nr:hypothetical protein ARMGADRAFT_1090973 [Armillaria gallica]